MTDVSLRARFERFPATVKGAFVVRGEDVNPHQISFHDARIVRVPGPGSRPISLTTVTLDVPPHKDLFVPFEFPIGELEPAWYSLEADVNIDGAPRTMDGGRRFCVPWPRSAIRSASLRLDRSVEVGDASVSLDRCQSGPEGTTIKYSVKPAGPVEVHLFADGDQLPVVEQDVEETTGKGIARAYPLLKSHSSLRIRVGDHESGPEVDVPL